MAIYLLKNGETQGPYKESIVAGWLMNGICSPQDLACRPGMKEWQPLSTIPLLQAKPQSGCLGEVPIAVLGGLILVVSSLMYLIAQSSQHSGMTEQSYRRDETLMTLGGIGFFLGLALLAAGIIAAAIRKR